MPAKRKTLLGALLMLVGAVLFVPPALPSVTGATVLVLVPAILLLTAGTYLVGTDVSDTPV